MFEIMKESDGNVIGVHMAGTVQKQDYAELVPKVEILAKQCGDIRILWDLGEFKSAGRVASRTPSPKRRSRRAQAAEKDGSKRERRDAGNSGRNPRGNPAPQDPRRTGNDEKVADLGGGGRLEGVQPTAPSAQHSEGHPPA
jgi:hypothetical protein